MLHYFIISFIHITVSFLFMVVLINKLTPMYFNNILPGWKYITIQVAALMFFSLLCAISLYLYNM